MSPMRTHETASSANEALTTAGFTFNQATWAWHHADGRSARTYRIDWMGKRGRWGITVYAAR